MQIPPFRVFLQFDPECAEARECFFKNFHFVLVRIIGTVVVIKGCGARFSRDTEQTSPADFGADIEIEFALHMPLKILIFDSIFSSKYKNIHMALIPNNNKKKKGGKP